MRPRHQRRRAETRGRMAHRRSLYLAVLYVGALCDAVPLNDLLDRASQHSDNLHSLSTLLTHQLDTDFPFFARAKMPRPSKCHTSSLHTPNDKEQALLVSESELLSLARSLLQAWAEPLVVLGGTAGSLPHPAHTSISSRVQELQDHSLSLGDGLEVLSARMGPSSQVISFLPYTGSGDLELGQDRNTRLAKFHFLLSCFRRDSHKIDSFLKVLRCRATKMRPDMC